MENEKKTGALSFPCTGQPGPENSDCITRAYLDQIVLEQRHIGSVRPETIFEFCGKKFSTPIMAGGMSPLKRVREEGSAGYAAAAKQADTVCWTGMIADEDYDEMLETGASCVRIIKPFADHDLILSAIEHDAENGAVAFSMDISHIFSAAGEYLTFQGNPLGTQTVSDLREYVGHRPIPFIVKDILSVKDAAACAEAGAAGVLVGHHQNLMSDSLPPLMVLAEIVKEVGAVMSVYLDCGMLSGLDVYKALALGADGVCVARPLRSAFAEAGPDGVTQKIKRMTGELRGYMAKTGIPDLKSFDADVLHFLGKH